MDAAKQTWRADETLDTSGLLCPIPIIKTAEKVKTMLPDQVLEIVSSDAGFEADLRYWCKGQRHEFLGCHSVGEIHRAFIRIANKQKR